MKIYPYLIPISATSTMNIAKNGKFWQSIVYRYEDGNFDQTQNNYKHYLKNSTNFQNELLLFSQNMQNILDSERNYVNDTQVYPKVINCAIFFLQPKISEVQWSIEFQGPFKLGDNIYSSYIDTATLDYPIHSIYVFDSMIEVQTVTTSLSYRADQSKRVVEYWGKKGEYLQDFEQISFRLY